MQSKRASCGPLLDTSFTIPARSHFETLRADPENINDNFRAYLNGFSDNVQDILARMNFNAQIDRMEEAGLLYQVIVDFCSDKADMKPEKISAVDMGYIFENLVQRFSESYNEEAGAHFTSRDIIYLMCDLLVTGDQNTFHGESITKTVYDMTMGTRPDAHLHGRAAEATGCRCRCHLFWPGVEPLHLWNRQG
ncbi:MAG: type I restriction-modification system subunit M N-terminal domain-containing protein [[Clostridium] scindens]